MKARIGFLLVTLVLAGAVGFAAEGLPWWSNPWAESFRSASTASLLEDDLDIMLDPAMMPTIEGYRLYTNLANIVDKNEEFFNPNANNYYLIGGTGNLMDYGKLGLLYDRRFESLNDTDLTTESETQYTAGIPVYRTVADVQAYTGSKSTDSHWWLGFGKALGTGRIGALIYHQVGQDETSSGSVTDITGTDLITGQTDLSQHVTLNGRETVDEKVWGGALSYWRPMTDKLEMGLAAGLNAYTAYLYDSSAYQVEVTNPSAPGTNGQTMNMTQYMDLIPHDHVGLEINVRAAGIYKWNDDVRTRTDLAFSTLSGSREDGYIDVNMALTEAYLLPSGGTQSTVSNATMNSPVAQENSYSAFSLVSKTTAKMGEKVTFSIGLGAASSKRDYGTTYQGTYNVTTVYNDGEPAVWSDYIRYADSSFAYSETYTESQFHLLAPVGLEFHITDNFVFRLGARHSMNYLNTSWVETNSTGPMRITEIDPNTNDTTYSVDPNPSGNVDAEGEISNSSYSQTAYTYGAGWKISDHLQLDFMGFAHLDDMTGWKASAIIKF